MLTGRPRIRLCVLEGAAFQLFSQIALPASEERDASRPPPLSSRRGGGVSPSLLIFSAHTARNVSPLRPPRCRYRLSVRQGLSL